jgi:hypothetical protein
VSVFLITSFPSSAAIFLANINAVYYILATRSSIRNTVLNKQYRLVVTEE